MLSAIILCLLYSNIHLKCHGGASDGEGGCLKRTADYAAALGTSVQKTLSRGASPWSLPPKVKDCDSVCRDLPAVDTQPVCMMASQYKSGYIYFANQCLARRTMCTENFVFNTVHWRRCPRLGLYFMPIPSR